MEESLLIYLLVYGIPFLILFLGLILGRVYKKINLKRLLKQLDSPDHNQRTKVLDKFWMESYLVKPLIKMLQDEEAVIRKGAAKALGEIGDPRAVKPLMKAVKDKDKAVRCEAMTTLAVVLASTAPEDIPRSSIAKFLIKILEDKSSESKMRWSAAGALGSLGSINGVKPLIKVLEESDVMLQINAMLALREIELTEEAFGEIWNSQAGKPLVKMLDDKEQGVRAIAAEVLDKLHWKPITDQEQILYNIAKRNWDFPLLSTSAAVEPLLRMLEDEHAENDNARVNAAMILGKIGEIRAIESLIEILKDRVLKADDMTLRETAAMALGEIGNARAVESLIKALKDKRASVRMAVVAALGEIGDIRSLEALIQVVGGKNPAVFGDRNPEVQKKAVEALGKIEDDRATTVVISALGDDDAIVRLQAAEILDKRGWIPQQDMEQIAYHIARANWDALILFGAQAITPLTKMIHDKDREVREQVAETLKKTLVCVHTMVFGSVNVENPDRHKILNNLDVSELTIPMPELKNLVVHAETHNFHLVERFMTYAVNYIGQKHLKKHVLVHIYGDPDNLHPNLRNSFENLCKCVEVHGLSKKSCNN